MADKIKLDDDRLMGLKNEIQMSVKFNEKELLPILDECLSRYTGTYIPPFAANWDIVVNEIYPVVQSYMPSIFFRTPRALLKPKQKTYIAKRRDPVSGEMIDMQLDSAKSATTQEAILNYSIAEEIDYKNEVRKVVSISLWSPLAWL